MFEIKGFPNCVFLMFVYTSTSPNLYIKEKYVKNEEIKEKLVTLTKLKGTIERLIFLRW